MKEIVRNNIVYREREIYFNINSIMNIRRFKSKHVISSQNDEIKSCTRANYSN